ncbi:hypothetical protein HDU96_008638 [Phlyctochytrium bullatum]|nr:hypothetical protein HDU96_008638 [Phlyctochytrium bullatum]
MQPSLSTSDKIFQIPRQAQSVSQAETIQSASDLVPPSPRTAALRIQKTYRGYRARKALEQRTLAAIKIQAIVRGRLQRRRLRDWLKISKQLAKNDDVIVNAQKRLKRKEEELRQLKATHSSRIDEVLTAKVARACLLIQKWARGWLARKRVRQIRKERRERHMDDMASETDLSAELANDPSLIARVEEASLEDAYRLILERLAQQRKRMEMEVPLALRAAHAARAASAESLDKTVAENTHSLGDLRPDQAISYAAVSAKIEEANRLIKQLSLDSADDEDEDLSLGCRRLRKECQMYADLLSDAMAPFSEGIKPINLSLSQKQWAAARSSHLSSIRDGKQNWWSYLGAVHKAMGSSSPADKEWLDSASLLYKTDTRKGKQVENDWYDNLVQELIGSNREDADGRESIQHRRAEKSRSRDKSAER